MAVLAGRGELVKAANFARTLFDLPQQPLPDSIAAAVEVALTAWDCGATAEAHTNLERALEFVRELSYT